MSTDATETTAPADDDTSYEDALPEGGVYTSTSTAADVAPAQKYVPSYTGTALATGRRKQAIVRVRLTPGTGQWKLNSRTLEDYFPNKVHQQIVAEPFTTLERPETYDVIARLHGGGISGQAGALRLGISRSLNQIDEENNRAALKKAGFLSRDARVKERKKAGLKKARKAPQFSKR